MQYCPRGFRQHGTRNNPVQCYFNTPKKIFRKKSVQFCLRDSRQHCAGTISVQCCLDTPGKVLCNIVREIPANIG